MSSTQSYSRFSDEKYKNWLKTTESLYIMRSRIQDFIEKETETYHNSLLNKPHLNSKTCEQKCERVEKIKHLCQLCEQWKKEIVANHNGNSNSMHWDNCCPYLWATNKWEVAKAHMPRGHKQHSKFEQFDIAAILNLMNFCKHFKNIPEQYVSNVIAVRNSVMHSPDLKVSNEDMKKHHRTLLQLAKKLVPRVPEMKDLEEEITQFKTILDNKFNQAPSEVDGQQEDFQTVKDHQKVLDCEQKALKDKVEDFISRFEGNQDKNVKEIPQDMKGFLDFLDQNKDILETLGPEVNKLKDMQAKVDQHEEQITNLTGRVDRLEKVKHGSTFFGKVTVDLNQEVVSHRCSSKEEATEAAFKVLWECFCNSAPVEDQTDKSGMTEYFETNGFPERVDNTTVSKCKLFWPFTFLDKDGSTRKKQEHLKQSQLISTTSGRKTYESVTMEYFNTNGFPKPVEEFVDDENICKLKLIGSFTFCDKDGSTKKKQAEQQAAKVALQHLSVILSCPPISDTEKNFKGLLKERLETLRLTHVYGATTAAESINQAAVKEHSNVKSLKERLSKSRTNSILQHIPKVEISLSNLWSSAGKLNASQREEPCIDCTEIDELFNVYNLMPPHVKVGKMAFEQNFKCTVTVNLEKYNCANKRQGYNSKKEAIRKTYLLLGHALAILDPSSDEKMSCALVKQHFSQRSLTPPQEDAEESEKLFYCSLKNITYDVKYEGQGSSDVEAKLHALQKALSSLSPLFGYPSLSGADSPEGVQNQLSTMLKRGHQREPVIDLRSEERACIQLSFCDYTLTCTCQRKKKAARNHLSKRILGLLGVKPEKISPSLRNSVDEWFKKQKLSQPVFENTVEPHGATATFSVQLTCCSPGWEDRQETAKTKLIQELNHRFQFLADE